jgi:non-specific serine/threonine protein kinase
VLDVLGSLTDKSLVQRIGGSIGEPRFGMLETIREYADECLGNTGEARAICELHRDWCLKLVEQERDLSDFGSAQIKRLDLEQDNLRAALRWSIGCDEAEAGLRLGIGCFSLWYVRGRYAEGRDWFGELLGLASSAACLPVHRGRALALAGYLASLEGQTATADSLLHKGLATAEQADDAQGVCLSSRLLGNLARQRGALAEAESRYEQVLTLARHEGGQASQEMRGHEMWTTYLLAIVRYELGDAVGAKVFVAQALELSRVHNYPAVLARALALSGLLAAHSGDHEVARLQIDASLAMLVELGDQQGLAYTHLQAGQVAMDRDAALDAAEHLAIGLAIARDTHERVLLARGLEAVAELVAAADPRRALRLVGTALAIRLTSGLQLTPVERVRMGPWIEAARRALGPSTADQALEDGGRESVQAAVADALEVSNSILWDRVRGLL